MAILVSADWVEERVDSSAILILDPRQPVHYLQGHIKNAANLPIAGAFDSQGRLLAEDVLERWLSAAGLGNQQTPVIYDAYDGQNGAMLAWILEYLGRADVHLLNIFFERWVVEGREVFYRPVKLVAREFVVRVKPEVRTTLKAICADPRLKLIDFRSRDEYAGKLDTDGKPGHISKAVNIVWQDLIGEANQILVSREKLQQMLIAAGIDRSDKIVAYCRTGPRAAVGYIALQQAGYDVSLYDGSYAEWARSGLPVEVS